MSKQQPNKPSAGRRWPVLLVALLALAALVWGVRAFADPFPRLEAAGFRITQEEYLRAMYQARGQVLSDHAAAGISLTDWDSPTALGDPCRLVTDRAVGLLREYYAVSTLAAERGYLADAGYDAALRELEERNRQQQEAMERGEPVTGIPRMTMDDYLTYRASSLGLRFCNDPENPENQVTAEELERRYEADRDDLYRQPDELVLAFLETDAAAGLEAEFDALRDLAQASGSLAAAVAQMPHLAEWYQQIDVTSATYSVYARSQGDVLACAEGLSDGELSPVISREGWLCLVQCLKRTEHTYVPLEEVRSVVEQSVRESRWDALIAGRAAELTVEGDLEELYRFTAEQLCK